MREIEIDLTDIRVVDGYCLRTALQDELVKRLEPLQKLSDEVLLFCDLDYDLMYSAYRQFVDVYSSFWNVYVLLDSLGLFSEEGRRKLSLYLSVLRSRTFNAYHSCL